jgi:nucleotide-binding universal stress UspA family protein
MKKISKNAADDPSGKSLKVLLAIDDSKYSEAALRMLVAQYNPNATTVRVLHVVEPLETSYYPDLAPPYPASLHDIRKIRLKAGREAAARATQKLRAAGFQADSAVRLGHARITVVDVAAQWHADLIVVGSHGRTGIERLLLGSVSDYVSRHAPCSVEIVRRPKG